MVVVGNGFVGSQVRGKNVVVVVEAVGNVLREDDLVVRVVVVRYRLSRG